MSNKLKIFLSGGMTGLTKEQASHWRTLFKIADTYQCNIFIDPTYLYTPSNNADQFYEKEAMEYDEFRTKIINLYDIEVIRFTNSDIDKNFEGVCALIDKTVKSRLDG